MYATLTKPSKAEAVMAIMAAAGIVPTTNIYNLVMDAYAEVFFKNGLFY